MKKFLLILTLATIGRTSHLHAQINAYAKVNTISGKTLTLSNVNQTWHSFAAGEQVIVLQMKDKVIGSNTGNNANFGKISTIASVGNFETATINTISGTTMKLTAALTKTYNTNLNGSVQVISFNQLSAGDYTLSSAVRALAWDGDVGGVVAFQVGGTLTLANSVSADGSGFRGGSSSADFELGCDPSTYNSILGIYGYKGESIDGTLTYGYNTRTGRGPLASGGGGGSDDNGGGGGGANYSAGGEGGEGWGCSLTTASGGLGGIGLGLYISAGRVFMGGGGGGGQQNNDVGSSGGSGGGIVFIRANTLKTSCSSSVNISASGLAAANSGNDGAGGAGAGGAIILSVKNFLVSSSCPLNVVSNGGNGGNVTDPGAHGGGGGGGQGAIIYSYALPSTNITNTAHNGAGGLNSGSAGATSAANGGGTDNAGIMANLPTLLPVNFVSFDAVKSGQSDWLSWTVSALSQHTQFTIQRSADGLSFQDIGVVDGIVDGTGTGSYVYTDQSPLMGKNFYRIRATDGSEEEKYSTTHLIDWAAAAAAFRLSPNPSQGAFTIQLMGVSTGSVLVQIEDLSGAIVYQSQSVVNAGMITVRLDKALPAGIYLVRVSTKDGAETGKLLIGR